MLRVHRKGELSLFTQPARGNLACAVGGVAAVRVSVVTGELVLTVVSTATPGALEEKTGALPFTPFIEAPGDPLAKVPTAEEVISAMVLG